MTQSGLFKLFRLRNMVEIWKCWFSSPLLTLRHGLLQVNWRPFPTRSLTYCLQRSTCHSCELKISWTGASARHSQRTFTVLLGVLGLSVWFDSPPGRDQLISQPNSLPECPEHMATGPVIHLQNPSSTRDLHLWKPLCSNMVLVMDKMGFAHKSEK